MGLQVYGRRALRRFERETGERIVHAVDAGGTTLTTVDHRHLAWTGERWAELAQYDLGGHPHWPDCGLATRLSSCSLLFGQVESGVHRGLMRGPCPECQATCSQLHRWNCGRLAQAMAVVPPDYWPRPVHRPQWLDDPRRVAALTLRLAYTMDVPVEVLLTGSPRSDWLRWEDGTAAERRRAANTVLAEVAPSVLRGMGLDPDRFTVTYETSPFDLRLRPHSEGTP